MPKLSVIMGIYNTNNETMVKQAIDSILNQTFRDFEFIICDDGSTDNTYEMVKNLVKDDKRCILIRNEKNRGLAQTLNNCLAISKGEYIARMDADDISLKSRFSKQVDFLDENPEIAVVGTYAYFIDQEGNRYKEFCLQEEIDLIDTVKKSRLIHPSTMIRRKVFEEVSNYTVNDLTTRAEDYDLWCKIAYRGYKMANIPCFLFEYREDIDSYRKRKYKYRIEEYKLKKYWIKKTTKKKKFLIYAYKPLIIGLIPSWIMIRRRIR